MMRFYFLLFLSSLRFISVCLCASLRPAVSPMAFQVSPAAAAETAAAAATAAAATAATAEAGTAAATAAAGETPLKRAALFPGQGAQCVGMGVACAKAHPASLKLFKEASAVLGYDLLDLCEKGPQETLNQTDKSQPALLTACMALYTHWKDTTDEPLDFDVCAGLSLGEFTALCFSGALPFKEAVSLTARRGALMQAAAEETPGDMYAILGLSREETEKICANVLEACPGAYCGVANYLCKGNYAVSVSRSAVRTLETFAAAAKAKRCIKLRVAGAFHSPLMAMAAGGLKEALEKTEIQKPQVPIILNVDGQIHSDPQTIKRILLQQLTSPTQWQQSMESLCQRGLKEAIEFGPGGVLSGLMKKINPNVVMKRVE